MHSPIYAWSNDNLLHPARISKWTGLTGNFLGESDDAHRKVYGGEKHEGKFSHELLAGAASFAGMKAFEDHQRKEGKLLHQLSHLHTEWHYLNKNTVPNSNSFSRQDR